MPEATHRRLPYRPELDGIRAIAVMLVVAQHLRLPYVPGGGYTGVTLFFVLSGYLITSLLVRERELTGRIDLRAFYTRRARRLLPALAVVIVVTAVLTLVTTLGEGWQIVAVLAYVSNWVRAFGVDMGWLAHAWSLSVEEQFYFVWPLVFILAPRSIVPIALAGICIGALMRIGTSPDFVSFSTPTRGDAILFGALVAVIPVKGRLLWLPAVAVMAVCVVSPDVDLFRNPGAFFVPVAAAALVAVPRMPGLAFRPLVEVGRRSYGIYLWHYLPIVVLGPALPSPPAVVAVLVLTALAAWASFRWVEQPFLRRKPSLTPAPELSTAPAP